MDKNLLINIQRIAVLLRYDIKCVDNKELLDIMIYTLNKMNSNIQMVERVRSVEHFRIYIKEFGKDILIDEKSDVELSEDEEKIFRSVMSYSLLEMKRLLAQEFYDEAYDLIDAIHAFPELFTNRSKKNLKKYWKIYIRPFQKKWRNTCFDQVKYLFI